MSRWIVAAVLFAAIPAQAADPPGLVHMTEEQQRTVKLQTAAAERRPITESVRVPGSITYDLGHVAILRPFGQGRVTRILVAPSEVVAAGQVLVELDMPSLLTAEQDLLTARRPGERIPGGRFCRPRRVEPRGAAGAGRLDGAGRGGPAQAGAGASRCQRRGRP